MREIIISPPPRRETCRLVIGTGLHRRLGELLAPFDFPPRVFVVTDKRVYALYGREMQEILEGSGFQPVFLPIPPGERSKKWALIQGLAQHLLARGAHRGTLLIGLGGGVVGDVTGFLASVFMRGVPVVQIPTTLLAMVDAAIGGKTAINLPEGKNLLGTFHQPRLVLVAPDFLATLPPNQLLNGLAEVLKAGFIRDRGLLDLLFRAGRRIFQDRDQLLEVIDRAAAIKAAIVSADYREAGLRRLLNFGHTLGHGLEAASRYRLPHGRAVALGMLMALFLSERLCGLPPEEAHWSRTLLARFGYDRTKPRLEPGAVLRALGHDKKRQEEKLVFVLLKHPGEPVIMEDVPVELITAALARVLSSREQGPPAS